MKIDIFHFSKWLYRVERTKKYLEILVWSKTERDSIKIYELKVTVHFFII